MRGSAVKTPATSVKISHASAPRAAASATAVVSEPPRPSGVTSLVEVDTPWNPATRTIRSSASASWILRARTSTIFAFVWLPSVTLPACEPAGGGRAPLGDSLQLVRVRHRRPTELHDQQAGGARDIRDVRDRLELQDSHL